ncbi:MAG: hypothetical protein RLZZ292_3993 [Bacteroidota bacterium]|jgi:hypothetical protein
MVIIIKLEKPTHIALFTRLQNYLKRLGLPFEAQNKSTFDMLAYHNSIQAVSVWKEEDLSVFEENQVQFQNWANVEW